MAKPKERFVSLCTEAMMTKGFDSTEQYIKRLNLELREVDDQDEYNYYLDLVEKKLKFPYNEHNQLIAFLLGLCDDFDINKEAAFAIGECPDIDCDYIPEVRDYLKKVWAKKQFGEDKVSSIANYATFGIKSALTDMARVYGKESKEIKAITTKLGLKDDEGDTLTFDKAIEISPELKAYCEANPEVADATRRLIGRVRGMGKHAGGLIISSVPISDMVPLVVDKDGNHVSAFTEGLHSQDLGPLGFVKFDLLVVDGLVTIFECAKLIKNRHNLVSLCAKSNRPDWSDTSYLNDTQSLVAADKGALKCVFQFDSDGIRKMVKQGGVISFNDLVAYTALYRPASLQTGTHNTFIKRKKKQEEYQLHPVMQSILGNTYGVQVYQEQVMQVLNRVGLIPLGQTEKLRKAISKKDEKKFKAAKNEFIENGIQTLSETQENVENLWTQLESWSGYGFNKSHAVSYTYISARLLWLKTHYPIEFFTAKLRCEQDTDKIKEYKLEAGRNGVNINPLDINKSGVNFDIVGSDIYIGFSNVKGIGEDVAKEIVAHQPYSSFEDFLHKFGTTANAIKPLIALGVFPEAPRTALYEFYEFYKEELKKREDRDKRGLKGQAALIVDLANKLAKKDESETVMFINSLSSNPAEMGEQLLAQNLEDVDGVYKLIKKYKKSVDALANKQAEDKPVSMMGFVPTGEIDAETKQMLEAIPQVAEQRYYGYNWDHVIQSSPDYEGFTFDVFDDESIVTACVECQITQKAEKKVSKNGKTVYYVMKVEDANGRQQWVTIWDDDYNRFADELGYWDESKASGHLAKIRLERPGDFGGFTFDSPPRMMRNRLPKDKKEDYRLVLMQWPENKDKK